MTSVPTSNRKGRSMSSASGISQSLGEIEEEKVELSLPSLSMTSTSSFPGDTSLSIDNESSEDTIYVAVGKDFNQCKTILEWTLRNFPSLKKIFIVHVHIPAPTIPMMGGKFPIAQLSKQEVKEYHLREREKKDKNLSKYLPVCIKAKVQAEKLMIEKDDIAIGLAELIAQVGIKRLVMGAAADKKYSKNMKMPKSKKASMLHKEAHPSCQIWFVCKRHLICTREGGLDGYVNESPAACPSTRSVQSEPSRPKSLYSTSWLNLFKNKSVSSVGVLHPEETIGSSPLGQPTRRLNPQDRLNAEDNLVWEGVPRNFHDSNPSSMTGGDETASNFDSSTMSKDGEGEDDSLMRHSMENFVEDPQNLSVHNLQRNSESGSLMVHATENVEEAPHVSFIHELETSEFDDLYEKLQRALNEAEKSKYEAHQESRKYRMAERAELVAIKRAKDLELKYTKEAELRKEFEEALIREKLEMENLSRRQSEIFEELQMAHDQNLVLEHDLTESNQAVRNLTEKLASLQHCLDSLKEERDELQRRCNDGIREAEKQYHAGEEVSRSCPKILGFSEFSYLEIHEATRGFESSLCIGEGGYGRVYKGFLRHTTVAIKILHSKSVQGPTEFQQEIDILSRVRHPNLVTLIGACSEECALVYEFLPNGSLEDRLSCVGNTRPISWHVRTRICAEICSTLIFLHSHKPQSVVHGDLKPANILLDANFTSKLADFGISRLLAQSSGTTTLYHRTDPKGTFLYMDPEFALSGELTPQSDVYSFGVIILRLLTGKPPLGIGRAVQEALKKGTLQNILDPTAGAWPFIQAQQLAKLGIRCCEMNRKNRPDLVQEVWRILESMKNSPMGLPSLGLTEEERGHTPSYFICPISQEITSDPHIAADGFTYEAEAIKGWLESGHDTSPMTNIKLKNHQLIPNIDVRTAIQEWLQHRL